jgi:TetR/AcrR family transcriptional regulator, regulator of autoinduction and epiphytic fitness
MAPRPNPRKQKSRAQIVAAAKMLFLAHGYGATSLADVAREAGVSTGTLFNNYPAKRDLFGAVMSAFWENEKPPPSPAPGDPRKGLRAIGMDYARLLLDAQTVPLFRMMIAEVPHFPELGHELYEKGKKPYLDRLQAYLAQEVRARTLKVKDAGLASRQFLGMINDIVFWPRTLVVDMNVTATEAAQVVDEAVETFWARYRGA